MVIFQGFLYVYQRVSQIIKGGIFNPGQPCFTHNQASLTHQASCGKNGTPPDQRSTPLEAPEDHNWFQCLPKFHGDFYRDLFRGAENLWNQDGRETWFGSHPVPHIFQVSNVSLFLGLVTSLHWLFFGGRGVVIIPVEIGFSNLHIGILGTATSCKPHVRRITRWAHLVIGWFITPTTNYTTIKHS